MSFSCILFEKMTLHTFYTSLIGQVFYFILQRAERNNLHLRGEKMIRDEEKNLPFMIAVLFILIFLISLIAELVSAQAYHFYGKGLHITAWLLQIVSVVGLFLGILFLTQRFFQKIKRDY